MTSKQIIINLSTFAVSCQCGFEGYDPDMLHSVHLYWYLLDIIGHKYMIEKCRACGITLCKECRYVGNCDCRTCYINDECYFCKECTMGENTTHKVYGGEFMKEKYYKTGEYKYRQH